VLRVRLGPGGVLCYSQQMKAVSGTSATILRQDGWDWA
jgi:hypothetical protein